MNRLELDLLFNLDFRLKVDLETFGSYCLQLEKETMVLVIDRPIQQVHGVNSAKDLSRNSSIDESCKSELMRYSSQALQGCSWPTWFYILHFSPRVRTTRNSFKSKQLCFRLCLTVLELLDDRALLFLLYHCNSFEPRCLNFHQFIERQQVWTLFNLTKLNTVTSWFQWLCWILTSWFQYYTSNIYGLSTQLIMWSFTQYWHILCNERMIIVLIKHDSKNSHA